MIKRSKEKFLILKRKKLLLITISIQPKKVKEKIFKSDQQVHNLFKIWLYGKNIKEPIQLTVEGKRFFEKNLKKSNLYSFAIIEDVE